MVRSIGSVGRYSRAEASSRSLPSSTRSRMSTARNVLLMLPTANAVSGVTWMPAATLDRPLTPRQIEPSGKMTVAETPGMALRARSRSSDAWRSLPSRAAPLRSPRTGPDGDAEGLGAGVAVGDADPGDGARLGDAVANARACPGGWKRPAVRPIDAPFSRAMATATNRARRMAGRYPARAIERTARKRPDCRAGAFSLEEGARSPIGGRQSGGREPAGTARCLAGRTARCRSGAASRPRGAALPGGA